VRCWNIFFFYTYDSLNRLVEQQVGSDERLTYEFNLLGQQTRIRQYVPANSSQAKDITYQYDSLSRVNQVTDANNRMLSYVYDKLNRRTRLTFPDSQYMQYGYDGDSRMTQVHYDAGALWRTDVG
jgi:YD repeat-containing protein